MCFEIPSEYGRLITSETNAPLLAGLSCACSSYCDGVRVLILFSGATLGSRVGVSMGSYSRPGVNQGSLRSIFSGAPLCGLRFTRSVQFGGIVTSLMNVTV